MIKKYDVVVIGAGAAGLSCSSYLARAGYSCLVLESMGVGGQLMIIAEIENYPGVNLTQGYLLAEEMEKQALNFGVEISYDEALNISKENEEFVIKTNDNIYKARAVVLATGAKHKKLMVKGEEEFSAKGVSYCATCDGPFFKGKKVTVIGGGDTALTDALYLAKITAGVTLIHRRNEFRAQKVLQDRVKNNENITLCLNHTVKEIKGDTKVNSIVLDDDSILSTDGIFIFTGINPVSFLVKPLVDLDNQGYVITDSNMKSSLAGLYAIGDVRNTPFRQVVTATGDGAIAAHSIDEYLSK